MASQLALPAQPASTAATSQNVESTAQDAAATQMETQTAAEDPRMPWLLSLATELGYLLQKSSVLESELAHAIVTRMTNRIGGNVYQSAAFSLPAFPKAALKQMLHPSLIREETNSLVTWSARSIAELRLLLGDMLSKRDLFGLTRPLKTSSERVIRVVATLIPNFEISWTTTQGREKVYINMMWILSDEDGEIFPPKDVGRREIQLTAGELGEYRQVVLSDLLAMSTKELPLSPKYFRQLGMEDKAAEVEAALAAPPPRKRTRAARILPLEMQRFEIDCIVEERLTAGRAKSWVLVRWAGYDPTWEAWRIHGEEGSPLETWEPRQSVLRTAAWDSWRASQDQEVEALAA